VIGMPRSGFNRAVVDVQRELRNLGLGPMVERITIDRSWSLLDHGTGALGLYIPGDRRCRYIGRIAIPTVALPLHNGIAYALRRCGFRRRTRASLRFVLRHELAHGLAHWLGILERPGPPWGMGTCFTSYATTSSGEDLAETVALHLTCRGRAPRRHLDQHLAAKWRAAGDLLHAGRRRCAARSASPQPRGNTR
jgi:hypothetical protein